MYFVDLIVLYCALRVHFRYKYLTNSLLHYVTYVSVCS